MVIPKDLLPLETRENTLKKVSEVISRFAEKGVPLLDPEEDLKVLLQLQFHVPMCAHTHTYISCNYSLLCYVQIQSSSYRKAARRIEALESLFDKHEIAKSPLIEQKLKVFHMKQELAAKIKLVKKTIRSSTVLAFKDEFKARKRALRRLG